MFKCPCIWKFGPILSRMNYYVIGERLKYDVHMHQVLGG